VIPAKVIADERERAGGVPEALMKLGVRVYFSQLPVADYVLSPEIAVERKSVSDLVSSVYDARLFYQASRISASFAKPYLLIEGNPLEVGERAKNLKSFFGAVANVTLAYGLRVIYTATPEETAIAIAELLIQSKAKPLLAPPDVAPVKAKTIRQQQVYLISSMPGVGTKLAQRLLMKYGTPRRIMNLTAGEMAMTKGIGWKRAGRVKEVLDSKFTRGLEGKGQMRLEG